MKSKSENMLMSVDCFNSKLDMVNEKTGPWAALVLGSVTRDILAETKTPALVFPTRMKRPIN